jgi:hypothetical protein
MRENKKELLEEGIQLISQYVDSMYEDMDSILAIVNKIDHDAYENAVHSWVASIDMILENRYNIIPDRWWSLHDTLQDMVEKVFDGDDGYETLEEANYLGQIPEEITVKEYEEADRLLCSGVYLQDDDIEEQTEFLGKDKIVISIES